VDPLGLAARAVGSAVAAGLAVVAATTFVVDALRPASGGAPDLGAPFQVALWGTLAGITLAAVVAWRLLSPIGSTYHRGGLSLVSAFATVIAMLVCIPVNQVLGRAGLAGLAALSLALSAFLARRTRAAGGSS
jgi:flagellar motor component MotA